MPSAGNHENELGNGPIGYEAYQTYFALPRQPGQTDVTRGLWYAFTVGSVRVIGLAERRRLPTRTAATATSAATPSGAQKAWLEKELKAARADRDIDWIVVCMHQVVMSSADQANGADLGIRQEWVPLFDRYGVDLVVCGARAPLRALAPDPRPAAGNETLTPIPAATRTDVDRHVEGHRAHGHRRRRHLGRAPTACSSTRRPAASSPSVGAPDPTTGKRAPVYVQEHAPWSASRNAANPYGFAAFTVDPGHGAAARPRCRSPTTTY